MKAINKDKEMMLFGNWLLRQKFPKLHVYSKEQNTFTRIPMRDILIEFKKDNGL